MKTPNTRKVAHIARPNFAGSCCAPPVILVRRPMTALAAAKGPAFDKLFLEGMIQHHGGALVMVRDLLKAPGAAQEAEIGDFASHVDADQRMEIIRMSAMLDTLKGIKR